MTSGPFLTKEGEDEWLRIKQHLEWSDHFALGFIFTEHPEVVKIFRERLADIYRARITRMEIPQPKEPSELFDRLLPDLLDPPLHLQALNAPYWVDISRQKGEEWTKARLGFLMRLNEQRETLRKALKRPLVLILPYEERSLIKKLVPDLWSIRDFTMVTGPWTQTESGSPASRHGKEKNINLLLAPGEKDIVDEWNRLKKKNDTSRGFLIAADRAVSVCLKAGEYKLASEIAQSMADVAKKIIDRVGETPESLRDLSVSLDNVGDTAKAMGEWDKAQKSFEESLAIATPLSEAFPNLPDYKDLKSHFQNRLEELDKVKSGK